MEQPHADISAEKHLPAGVLVGTSLGPLCLVAGEQGLLGAFYEPPAYRPAPAAGPVAEILRAAEAELREYLSGKRRIFTVPLAPVGTVFQRRVWEELARIPYEETLSYAALARAAGRPSAVRAVGAANGRNPLAIFLPCHRVIASDGSLGGYNGGLERKARLLALERGGP